LVRQTFAAELPVPSDSRTIFRAMKYPADASKEAAT
jgi:hypothetical protein